MGLLGLPYALYAFSNGVCNLIRLILDAIQSQELVIRGVVLDSDAEDSSMGTTTTSWWFLMLSGTTYAASDYSAL